MFGMFTKSDSNQEIRFSSGIYTDKRWNNSTDKTGVIDVIGVPDKETAINIANIIFENIKKNKNYSNFTFQSVFYDDEDNVWIVNYYPNEKGYIGADLSIAISKKTAEILKVWVGE